MNDLTGKVALVTGAGRGIAAAVACRPAGAGLAMHIMTTTLRPMSAGSWG